MSPIERFCLARWIALIMFTIEIATMIPMIATTIRSSMSVNPRRLVILPLDPLDLENAIKKRALIREDARAFRMRPA